MHIAIVGKSRCGKDTVCNWLAQHTDLKYAQSTSEAAALVVYARIKDKYNYATADECWQDRHNHREEWAEIIWNYNKPDGLTLYREMAATNDLYNGIRRWGEMEAAYETGLISLSVWVDRPDCKDKTMEFSAYDCDLVLYNHFTKEELYRRLGRFARCLNLQHCRGS